MNRPEDVRKLMADAEEASDEQQRRAEQTADNIEIGDDIPSKSILPTIMTLDEMHQRLVFIGAIGAVVDRQTGRVRKKENAFDEYSASWHSHAINGKTRKEPALKAWLRSKDQVTVDVLTWVPGAKQVCRPPEPTGAETGFNTWRGLMPMDAPDDWAVRARPFLNHVEFLVPIKAERERFLQWLAHIVQRPEVLPHTAYLMTTKTTGIGRNLLASILVRVLRGHVAAGISLPELLDGGFTGRLSRKLLAIVDEAREGSGDRRYQRAERLKSLITEEHRHVNPKYGIQTIEKNCCRWLMFSNHRDAIPFDQTDRRIIVIENPTERQPAAYYEKLFGLLDDSTFIASVRMFLETLDIADFRPGEHADRNEAKQRVLHEMMSETERAVFEFKQECQAELTSRIAIRKFVDDATRAPVNENHLTHAITSAGMTNTGRRVTNRTGQRHSIVIVKGAWTTEMVLEASTEALLAAMEESPPF